MRKPPPALILSIIAIVLACAGSATAGSLITGAKIKDGTITSKDVRDRSIAARDLKSQAVSTRNLTAATVDELQSTVATTRVSRSEPIVPLGSSKTIDVACPEGQTALGGGGGFLEYPEDGQIGSSKPILDESGVPRGWRIAGQPLRAENQTLEVYAVCAV